MRIICKNSVGRVWNRRLGKSNLRSARRRTRLGWSVPRCVVACQNTDMLGSGAGRTSSSRGRETKDGCRHGTSREGAVGGEFCLSMVQHTWADCLQGTEARLQSDFRSVQSERAKLQQLIENYTNVSAESERSRGEERKKMEKRIDELTRETLVGKSLRWRASKADHLGLPFGAKSTRLAKLPERPSKRSQLPIQHLKPPSLRSGRRRRHLMRWQLRARPRSLNSRRSSPGAGKPRVSINVSDLIGSDNMKRSRLNRRPLRLLPPRRSLRKIGRLARLRGSWTRRRRLFRMYGVRWPMWSGVWRMSRVRRV